MYLGVLVWDVIIGNEFSVLIYVGYICLQFARWIRLGTYIDLMFSKGLSLLP